MPIDWSNNENNVRLLVSTYAVLGKEAVSKSELKQEHELTLNHSSRARDVSEIAERFGNGASYDAIQKRFKTIAAKAETLQGQGMDRPRPKTVHIPRPERPRKRHRPDDTISLEADDIEVIEEGRFRTPAQPLRKSTSRLARPVALGPDTSLSPDIEIVANVVGVSHQDHFNSTLNAQSPRPTFVVRKSSIEPASNLLRPSMPSSAVDSIEERLRQSSQDHADERAKYRRMYMDNPPTNMNNPSTNMDNPSTNMDNPSASRDNPSADMAKKTSGSMRPPQNATWRHPEVDEITPKSYIDAANRGCVLCKKKWTSLQQAQQHERESDLHRANLLIPERVRVADMKFIEIRGFPPPVVRLREDFPGEAAEVEPTQPLASGVASVPSISACDSPNPSSIAGSRESSVIIVDGSPRPKKGKARAMPSATPTPDLVHVGRDLQRLSTRHTKSMIGKQMSCTPSTSEYVASSSDEEDEDMNMVF